MRGLKETYNYNGENLGITEMLDRPEIYNFTDRGKGLKFNTLRKYLQKSLEKHGTNFWQEVAGYNRNNPTPQQQRQFQGNERLYGAQRQRADLPKKRYERTGDVWTGTTATTKEAPLRKNHM